MNAWRNMLRAACIMMVFATIFTALMAGTFSLTQHIVAKNEEKAKLALLVQVLPSGSYDNDLLHTFIRLNAVDSQRLGNDKPSQVYLAQKNGRTENIILETTAPDGYGGKIHLLIGISRQGIIQAVRVLAHKETPGLGDYIDLVKSQWIMQFTGKSLQHPPLERWQVKKDSGAFDYRTGATISARAIVKAVPRTLAFVQDEHQRFFEAI